MRFYLCNIFFMNLFFITWRPHYSQNRVKISFSLIHSLAKNMIITPFGWNFIVVGFFYILPFEWRCCIWVGAISCVLSPCPPRILNELTTHVHRAAQHLRVMKSLYHITPEVHLYHMLSNLCFHLHLSGGNSAAVIARYTYPSDEWCVYHEQQIGSKIDTHS